MEAIADTRLAPPTHHLTAVTAAITNVNTKRTTIQTKLSIMTNAFANTNQFGSHETTINSRTTPVVGSKICVASALPATKATRNRTAASGMNAFQTGNPANSPPKNSSSASQAFAGLSTKKVRATNLGSLIRTLKNASRLNFSSAVHLGQLLGARYCCRCSAGNFIMAMRAASSGIVSPVALFTDGPYLTCHSGLTCRDDSKPCQNMCRGTSPCTR